MRASMTIPGVFAPVRKNGMVLVDGGLKNNYPADMAKAMGADVIIGVLCPTRVAESGGTEQGNGHPKSWTLPAGKSLRTTLP